MIIDLNCMLYLRPLESLHLPRKYINYLSYFIFLMCRIPMFMVHKCAFQVRTPLLMEAEINDLKALLLGLWIRLVSCPWSCEWTWVPESWQLFCFTVHLRPIFQSVSAHNNYISIPPLCKYHRNCDPLGPISWPVNMLDYICVGSYALVQDTCPYYLSVPAGSASCTRPLP